MPKPTPNRPFPLRELHIVSHTHWDREWYHTVDRFRPRLLALVESLLQRAPDAARPFLLDGQTVILEDVLAVRPEWLGPLRQHLALGAIEAGPWYVLSDELIPSGELLVRNLLAGRRQLARLGAESPRVCYSPDSFGHPAALPMIANGFGLTVGVLWRGYGGRAWPKGDSVRWQSPDGSELLCWHLPPDGYEYGSALPVDAAAARRRWAALHTLLAERSATGVALLTNGADHHALQPDIDEAVSALAHASHESGGGVQVSRSSLTHWARAFALAANDRTLPVVRGELRDSRGYTWSLQGTFGTRAWQKRALARVDRTIRWDVEPWMALARLRRESQRVSATVSQTVPESAHAATVPNAESELAGDSTDALLDRLWRTVLRATPHDTLCGCSVDEVSDAFDQRLSSAREQVGELREVALDALLGRDRARARSLPRSDWKPQLVIRNPSASPKWGVVHATLLSTLADVAVGPGSSSNEATHAKSPLVRLLPEGMTVQSLGGKHHFARRESPQHYPDNDLIHTERALVFVPPTAAVPALGLSCWPLNPAAASQAADTADAAAPTSLAVDHRHVATPFDAVRATRIGERHELENGALRVVVKEGQVTLLDRTQRREFPDLLRVTWQSDVGDSYTASPRGAVRELRVKRARIVATGPLRASVVLHASVRVPRHGADAEVTLEAHRQQLATAQGEKNVNNDRRRLTKVRVRLTLSLDAHDDALRITAKVRNRAHDHRLRLVIATGVGSALHVADAAFGPVERATSALPLGATHEELLAARRSHDSGDEHGEASGRFGDGGDGGDSEMQAPTAPLHRWVSIVSPAQTGDASHAITLFSDGLAEYQVTRAGELAVTLLRATGELSRRGLPERPGHAGWPAAIPKAQGVGKHTAHFAFRPAAAYSLGDIEQYAQHFLQPLTGTTWRDASALEVLSLRSRDDRISAEGISLLSDADVVASAVRPADDGCGVILRALNLADGPRVATWRIPVSGLSVHAVRLDETAEHHEQAENDLAITVTHTDGATMVHLSIAARAVSSIRVWSGALRGDSGR